MVMPGGFLITKTFREDVYEREKNLVAHTAALGAGVSQAKHFVL
jgi:hypothetical protein